MFHKPFIFAIVAVFFVASCTLDPVGMDNGVSDYGSGDMGGGSYVGDRGFKVPVPPGYDWEITQSWKEHCAECSERYHDWNYCAADMSHTWNCCKYGWDFNLPSDSDMGKPVLATADGRLVYAGHDDGWGNHVIIDHGNNICSRYAHMLDGSIDHLSVGQSVCQGLKLGEIGKSGNSRGYHLHFQFETCDTREPIPMRFTDGNGIPKCTRGNDVYDSRGNYNFLILSNRMVYSCDQSGDTFGGGELPKGGWFSADCGTLPGCPLIPNCGRESGHRFSDRSELSSIVAGAGEYLYSECALDGKADGGLHPSDKLTRAEALKVPMFLYGMMDGCGSSEPFADVDSNDWYFEVVACAVRHGIITSVADYFRPNDEVTLAEAAKFVVEAASRAGVIEIQNPSISHFPNISKTHWAYEYVETIYYYGGFDRISSNISPEADIERGDYFVMVASLSPCYCRNVSCESGCECKQDVFACVDPNDHSSGTGGGETDSFAHDVDISCAVDSDDTECLGGDTVMLVRCEITNNGNSPLDIRNLTLLMTDTSAASVCDITDDSYIIGVGHQIALPGQTRHLTGHFELTCSQKPADGAIDASIGLTQAVSGPDPFFPNVDSITISLPDEPFASCYCEERTCGNNPYGGSCGSCAMGQECDDTIGQCVCVFECGDRECGPDYCGGYCGFCGSNELCDETTWQCVPTCVPSCTGITCGFDGCGGVCNSCPSGQSCNAPAGQCEGDYQTTWNNCDPSVGYTVAMASPGGTYEIATSGPTPYLAGPMGNGTLTVNFDCVDMPASILIHGGSQYVQTYLTDSNLPYFSYWVPYNGQSTINPPYGASGSTYSFFSGHPNLSFLLRTPNP